MRTGRLLRTNLEEVSLCSITNNGILFALATLVEHVLHLRAVVHDIRAKHRLHYRIGEVGASSCLVGDRGTAI